MPTAATIHAVKPPITSKSSGVDSRYLDLHSADIEKYKGIMKKGQTFAHERHGIIPLQQRIAAQAETPKSADTIKPIPLMNFDNKLQAPAGPAISLAKETHGKESVLMTLDLLSLTLPGEEAQATVEAARNEVEILWGEMA